jgi:hypothetical protein
MNPNPKMPKHAKEFVCEFCDFKCSKPSNYETHLATPKHKKLSKPNIYYSKNMQKIFQCEFCNHIYKHASTLSAHRKKCKKPEPPAEPPAEPSSEHHFKLLTSMMIELMKSNSDLQKQMLEVCKNSNNTVINSNNHNKTFNLQVFLNEQCKDAMNIMDFVNSMTLELSDLEDVGTLGYVEGISNIIIRKLGELDIYKRPIHCSDGKREIMYVKDNNIWGKENDTNDKLRLAIKHVTYKNSSLLVPWSQAHPNCMNTQHHLNDVYVKMIGQAMGGKGEFVDNENKIMKKIAKAVLIDKTC